MDDQTPPVAGRDVTPVGRYFEDWEVGDTVTSAGITVTEAMIIDFALKYDPQPFHLDVDAAGDSVFDGLVASGFLTLSLAFRLFKETGVINGTSIGGRGMDELRWTKPLVAGDRLSSRVRVVEKIPSRSRADRGTILFRFAALNRAGEEIMTFRSNSIIRCRPV